MSALDSIIKWAEEDLLDWQKDSVRRLLTQWHRFGRFGVKPSKFD